jgi:hypothetical protein
MRNKGRRYQIQREFRQEIGIDAEQFEQNDTDIELEIN